MDLTRRSLHWGPQGWLGLLLVAVFWPLNWALPGNRTAYLFFPLWLGYILVVDALVQRRTGSSLWRRSRRGFVLLFVASVPAWWLFEAINSRTGNWEYLGSSAFSDLEYYLLCTLSFSIVMPAVFETAELAASFHWMGHLVAGACIRARPALYRGLLLAGTAMLASVLIWPKVCYPFVWTSLVFILEPLNCWLGRRHFLQDLERGDWRLVASLALGALICGFFWEMWNYWSYPQWIYHTPGVQFLHIFEMPLLGYGGYVPFALELCALKNFLWPGSPQLQLGRAPARAAGW